MLVVNEPGISPHGIDILHFGDREGGKGLFLNLISSPQLFANVIYVCVYYLLSHKPDTGFFKWVKPRSRHLLGMYFLVAAYARLAHLLART